MEREVKGFKHNVYWYILCVLLVIGLNGILWLLLGNDSLAKNMNRLFDFDLFVSRFGYFSLFVFFVILTGFSLKRISNFKGKG